MEDIGAAITAKETLDETIYAQSIQIQASYVSEKVFLQSTQTGFPSMPNIQSKQYQSLNDLPIGLNPFSYSEGFIDDDYDKIGKQPDLVKKDHQKHDDKSRNTVMIKNLPKGVTCHQLLDRKSVV